MKKFISAMATFLLAVIASLSIFAFVGCDNTDNGAGSGSSGVEMGGKEEETDAVKAESITLEQQTINLASKEEKEFVYTVQPADAEVKVEVADKTVVKYEEGNLTALTAGTTQVKVYSVADETVYAECSVTVSAPNGYKVVSNTEYKFVCPSSWTKQSMAGAKEAYANASNTANLNLIATQKTNAYYSMTADVFKNALIQSYQSLGYTVTFTNCTVSKNDYLGYTRVHVIYDYSVTGLGSFHQEQMVLNSGQHSYILTVTYSAQNEDKTQTETIFSEFVGLK